MDDNKKIEDVVVDTNNTNEGDNNQQQVQQSNQQDNSDNKKSFVKIREEKARESVFKELGVKDIDEAKQKLANADKALEKITEIEKKLEEQENKKIYNTKVDLLTKILEKQNVFDADALVHYVDIDSIELDKTGNIKDSDEIIKQLKDLKPNYFGKEFIKTDSYKKGNTETSNTNDDYTADYEAGNYQAVIAKFLKNTKK